MVVEVVIEGVEGGITEVQDRIEMNAIFRNTFREWYQRDNIVTTSQVLFWWEKDEFRKQYYKI